MAKTTFRGDPVETVGALPAPGTKAPDFTLVKGDLSEMSLAEAKGKQVVLNVFLSLDTSTCAASVRRFNEEAAKRRDTVVLCISMDLPFAAARFCAAEGLENVITLSDFREGAFGRAYGLRITGGPFTGLLARSVFVLDREGKVVHAQLVPDISKEPDYEAALAALL
ncbi:MAG: thiol peroxidase [Candidatus Eisenbacteria bacterium]|nr:thiol peroxidase [Candidatus Eisenbacteria bacterium]